MRRTAGLVIALTCLAILIHDAVSGRMSVFRDLYDAEDLNEQLREHRDTDWPSALILVRRGADPNLDVSAYGSKGLTPLHLAAGRGDIGAAQLLLSKGADMKRTCSVPYRSGKRRAIHLAAEHGLYHMVAFLVDNGADPNGGAPNLPSPLCLACTKGHADVVAVLIDKGARRPVGPHPGTPLLHLAASKGHPGVVACLLGKGIDINGRNHRGMTALHVAVAEGKANVVPILLSRGADVNLKDHSRKTALDWANRNGAKELATRLRSHGGKAGEELDEEVKGQKSEGKTKEKRQVQEPGK